MPASRTPLDFRRLLPVGPRGWLVRTPGFTAREVRQLLRRGAVCERGRAVAHCLARPADWLPAAPHPVRCPQHYHQHLTRIVFWHARGDSPATIGLRLSGYETIWGVERALEEACRGIARCLNRDPRAYGVGAFLGE